MKNILKSNKSPEEFYNMTTAEVAELI